MALVTLIDPKITERWNDKFKSHPKWANFFLGKVTLTEKEGDGIFYGLCIVVGL